MQFLYGFLAGIFILILSTVFAKKPSLSCEFVDFMSFIPAVNFAYQDISLEKAFFVSLSFIHAGIFLFLSIKKFFIICIHERGLFNIYEIKDESFYEKKEKNEPLIIFVIMPISVVIMFLLNTVFSFQEFFYHLVWFFICVLCSLFFCM